MRKSALIICAVLILLGLSGVIHAEKKVGPKPYESPFQIKTHVDGTPLLVDGRFEYYLFPDAKREKTPDRYQTCSDRIFAGAANLAVSLIRSAARNSR
jgi:hypothetical protein